MHGSIHRPHIKRGNVVFLRGLAFHIVIKSGACKYGACRRVTIRYLDGDITKWRQDGKPSVWPFISQFAHSGKLVSTTLPSVCGVNSEIEMKKK